jgi:thiol-disulfide isomerase/thioredoxin
MNILRYFLVLSLALSISCKKENVEPIASGKDSETKDNAAQIQNDTLSIHVLLPPDSGIILNMTDHLGKHYSIDFENKSDKDSLFTQTIINKNPEQLISKGTVVRDSLGNWVEYRSYFLVTDTTRHLDLSLKDYNLNITAKRTDSLIDVSQMIADYNSLRKKVFQEKGTDLDNLKELDRLRQFYQLRYADFGSTSDSDQEQKLVLQNQLNQHYYFEILYDISPEHPELTNVFSELNLNLKFPPANGIRSDFIKMNIDSLNYDSIDSDQYTDTFRENLKFGLMHYLSWEKEKKIGKHQAARDWFATTDLYQKYQEEIEARITPLDENKVADLLKSIALVERDGDTLHLTDVMKDREGKYYLLDFWATWCKPCMENHKLFKKVELPRSLQMVNLSVDLEKYSLKWEKFSDSLLSKKPSYRVVLNDDYAALREALKIERIPRYLMITKDFEMMHQRFYAPYEPQFPGAISSLDQWRYW